jgi:hypothetical protein
VSEYIFPSVIIDGETYYPQGWMWVLAFAIRGKLWAIKECEKPWFKEAVKDYLKDEKNHGIIESYIEEIERLKDE